MAWSLVCPASRGIGFHLSRYLLQNTNIPVVATARTDIAKVRSSILDGLDNVDPSRLNILEVDVTSKQSYNILTWWLEPSRIVHASVSLIIQNVI
jgi:hypothetical protein